MSICNTSSFVASINLDCVDNVHFYCLMTIWWLSVPRVAFSLKKLGIRAVAPFISRLVLSFHFVLPFLV